MEFTVLECVGNVVSFPGTHVKREYVTVNGIQMLEDVWDCMCDEANFTGSEDPRILKRAYQIELENFINEFEAQDLDAQPFIDELKEVV